MREGRGHLFPPEIYQADLINEVIERVLALRVKAGHNVREIRTAFGIALEAGEVPGYEHPWTVKSVWDAEVAKWKIRVKPGFVEDVPPIFEGTDGLTLLDAPIVPINGWRVVGRGGASDEPVPPHFLAQGVAKPLPGLENPFSFSQSQNLLDELLRGEEGSRQLRAVDLVVTRARAALEGSVELVDATASGAGIVANYQLGLNASRVEAEGVTPRIRLQASRFEPVKEPSLIERIVTGVVTDEQEDRTLIATIYALSPVDASEDAIPDENWSVQARYGVDGFWNLNHQPGADVPHVAPPPITLQTGLAFGILDSIANQILSTANEWSARLNNAINGVQPRGHFWTA